jgi:predicted enzyme related to lactoylglutathione lyase
MAPEPVLRSVDCVTIPVPDLDRGLAFYRDVLGQELLWRDDRAGRAGLRLPRADTEIVLSESLPYEPAWLVGSAEQAAREVTEGGGEVVDGPVELPVGTLVVVRDPFGNRLVLLDLAKGRYVTDADGRVTGVA